MERSTRAPLAALWFLALTCVTTIVQAEPAIYYVQDDHLGTPQALYDENRRIVWQSDYTPFGIANVDEDPDGDGRRMSFPIRFPGQYLDMETGLYYNYFRDYEPTLGRYVQSDPIGLGGGLNTYAYANSDPISHMDIFGLRTNPWNRFQRANPGYTPTENAPRYRQAQLDALARQLQRKMEKFSDLPDNSQIATVDQGGGGPCGLLFGCPLPWIEVEICRCFPDPSNSVESCPLPTVQANPRNNPYCSCSRKRLVDFSRL